MRWEKVEGINPIGEGPGKRWGHTCNAVKGGRFIYLFGGYGRHNRQTNEVHVFDTGLLPPPLSFTIFYLYLLLLLSLLFYFVFLYNLYYCLFCLVVSEEIFVHICYLFPFPFCGCVVIIAFFFVLLMVMHGVVPFGGFVNFCFGYLLFGPSCLLMI